VDDLKVVVKQAEIEVGNMELYPLDDDDDPGAEGEGEIIEVSDGEEECAPRRVAPEPGDPTPEEREDHNVDHLPYRCWCDACVKGRGVGEHLRSGVASSVPVIGFDYLIITKSGVYLEGEAGSEEALSRILVCNDFMSKYILALAVSVKGAGFDRYAMEKLKNDIAWLGYSRVILRSDNEPAIIELLRETLKDLKVDTVEQAAEEHPPAYDSKANGSVENAVKLVQGLLRTLKFCLEARLGVKIPMAHPILAWLIRHAAWLISTRARRSDGKTAHERLRGRPFARRLLCFGEICLGKLPPKGPASAQGKQDPRRTRGVFLNLTGCQTSM